ncbi:MAG: hypothetical protein JWP85_810 [Rhodoglobus sp.]|nr:hypothetical protein [Rhodoglobus sp.]
MTDVLTRGSLETSATTAEPKLRVRGPAYAVMMECLRIQSGARRQSRIARFLGINPLLPDARSWYRGALGELHVAKLLKALPAGFTVLHAVPVGSGTSDIDHVVIGPTGVFTINTKNHSGQRVWVGGDTLLVNGHRTNHIRDARYEASRATRLLNSGVGERVDVTPVIAIVDPGSLTFGRERPQGVVVLHSSRLERVLVRRKPVLSDALVASLVQLAEVRGTWHSDSSVLDDTLRHEARFTRLREAVEAAARRRFGWVLGAIVAACAGAASMPVLFG